MNCKSALVVLALTGLVSACGGKGSPSTPLSPSEPPPASNRAQVGFIRGPWSINANSPYAGVAALLPFPFMAEEGTLEVVVSLPSSEEHTLMVGVYDITSPDVTLYTDERPVTFQISKMATVSVPFRGLSKEGKYIVSITNPTPVEVSGEYAVIYLLN